MLDSSSLERIVPDQLGGVGATGLATLHLHMARYRFAAQHLAAGTLLDMACGSGYGTHHLAEACPRISHATGVDLSQAAIEYASKRYAHERIAWKHADAMTFRGDAAYDNIVSLETIEHLPRPSQFFHHLVELLAPGGILVASVPTTPSMDGNPHHLTDFTERTFRHLARGLPLRELAELRQEQPFGAAAVLSGKEQRLTRSRASLAGFYVRHPIKLISRIAATTRYGFVNRYLTIAWVRVK